VSRGVTVQMGRSDQNGGLGSCPPNCRVTFEHFVQGKTRRQILKKALTGSVFP
jgi:hypothetical protein